MPTNLPPEYYDVEKRYRAATSPDEKIVSIEEMLSIIPKHKGTDKLRADLRRRGILSALELRNVPDGRFVRTAGHVIVRQRPGSAKGFTFLTLEDETGTSNAILTPAMFRRFRVAMASAPLVEIAGPLQNAEGVVHVRIRHLRPLSTRPSDELPHPHDYH